MTLPPAEESAADPEAVRAEGSRPRAEVEPVVVSGRGRIRRESLDPDSLSVVERLQRTGHAAYFVGGCVRDLLLGIEPKDFDVATDATPSRIRKVFRNARIIGRRFRLAHVWFPNGHVVETATFRADPGESGLHPTADDRPIWSDNVFGTAAEDARRRDFTVNAMFYDPHRDEIVDYVGGLADVDARVIRSIGDPTRRLKEDPVRMIRAVHFAARMGGEVEPTLLDAIRRCSGEIAKASPSRLYVELIKVLTRGFARPTLRALFDLGVLDPWLPELCVGLEREMGWPTTPGGTHEVASEGEPENVPAAHETWNLLGAADAWGMAPRGVPDSLALAVLFGPWLLESFASGRRRGHDLFEHVEEAFRPLALRMSIPKRACFELREILAALDRLRHPPTTAPRVRAIVRRPSFPEALAYYGLDLRARDHDLAPIEAWHDRAEAALGRVGARAERGQDPAAGRPATDGRDAAPPFETAALRGMTEDASRGRRRRGRRRRRDEDLSRLDGAPGPDIPPEADAWFDGPDAAPPREAHAAAPPPEPPRAPTRPPAASRPPAPAPAKPPPSRPSAPSAATAPGTPPARPFGAGLD